MSAFTVTKTKTGYVATTNGEYEVGVHGATEADATSNLVAHLLASLRQLTDVNGRLETKLVERTNQAIHERWAQSVVARAKAESHGPKGAGE